ncbi:hypothetical protein HDU97_007292 [Phlyctochytrium planicorne]|nr:hypothetical protein HDU97_007292 [Phlyctochytrium planicorne]
MTNITRSASLEQTIISQQAPTKRTSGSDIDLVKRSFSVFTDCQSENESNSSSHLEKRQRSKEAAFARPTDSERPPKPSYAGPRGRSASFRRSRSSSRSRYSRSKRPLAIAPDLSPVKETEEDMEDESLETKASKRRERLSSISMDSTRDYMYTSRNDTAVEGEDTAMFVPDSTTKPNPISAENDVQIRKDPLNGLANDPLFRKFLDLESSPELSSDPPGKQRIARSTETSLLEFHQDTVPLARSSSSPARSPLRKLSLGVVDHLESGCRKTGSVQDDEVESEIKETGRRVEEELATERHVLDLSTIGRDIENLVDTETEEISLRDDTPSPCPKPGRLARKLSLRHLRLSQTADNERNRELKDASGKAIRKRDQILSDQDSSTYQSSHDTFLPSQQKKRRSGKRGAKKSRNSQSSANMNIKQPKSATYDPENQKASTADSDSDVDSSHELKRERQLILLSRPSSRRWNVIESDDDNDDENVEKAVDDDARMALRSHSKRLDAVDSDNYDKGEAVKNLKSLQMAPLPLDFDDNILQLESHGELEGGNQVPFKSYMVRDDAEASGAGEEENLDASQQDHDAVSAFNIEDGDGFRADGNAVGLFKQSEQKEPQASSPVEIERRRAKPDNLLTHHPSNEDATEQLEQYFSRDSDDDIWKAVPDFSHFEKEVDMIVRQAKLATMRPISDMSWMEL